jgi:hypothetical protein
MNRFTHKDLIAKQFTKMMANIILVLSKLKMMMEHIWLNLKVLIIEKQSH